MLPRFPALFPPLLALALMLVSSIAGLAEEAPFTTAAEVLAMASDKPDYHRPVRLTGVVTAAEPDWENRYFVQDETGGVFIVANDRKPRTGERVTVTGVSSRGAFAPVVINAESTDLGLAPMPAPKPTTAERLVSGIEDGQRVEFTGIARAAYIVPIQRKLGVDVIVSGLRVHVFPKLMPQMDPDSFIGARVRVRGTVAASFNAKLHQLTSINVYVPTAEDFTVIEPEPAAPFAQPILPLAEIARYRPEVNHGGRIHVRGVVTFQRRGLDLYIQDQTGGLHLETTQVLALEPGETIEAVGFHDIAGYRPVLEDAVCRRTTAPPVAIAPIEVPFSQLREGRHAGELIVMRGRLIGRTARPVRRDNVGFSGLRTLCTIQDSHFTFTVECEHPSDHHELEAIPLGSTVAVTGIAMIETGDDGQLRTLTLLQRTPDDMRVLTTPGWWNARRLLVAVLGLLVLSLAVVGWSFTVSKKNTMLSFLVAERERAQLELQQAHDSLEQRVKERTEELKVEMTQRKSAEVEFKATLAERTRLARDLHDTLEQALTGIALQLDTTAKLLPRDPGDAARHLELARGFMRQSQIELRRSIWDLRSRELDQFDVAQALLHTSRQIADGTPLRVEMKTEGAARPLPEVVEENLLRIGQEALTNIVKHAGATRATMRLGFDDNFVSLMVSDNGSGLVPSKGAATDGAHFGLLGMSERAKRLGGRFSIVGHPGEGTTVTVSLPIDVHEVTPART